VEEQRRELSAEQWIGVIRQVAGDFDSSRIMVAVTGGEPLMKKGVLEIFSALHHYGFAFGMVSNAFLISEEMAVKLVKAGIGSISLSMDAPPKINDRLRGEGASAAVEQAILNLRAAGFGGKLEIISTITAPAVPYLDEMRRYVAQLKVPLWRVAPVMPIGRAAEQPELVPNAQQVRDILEFVHQSRKDEWRPRPEFSEEGYLGNRYEGNVRPYLCQCGAGVDIAGILSDGRIGACPELSDAFVQGDIKTERFRTVWETRYQALRDRSWTQQGICADCSEYERCGGGALHLYQDGESGILRCLYKQAKEAESGPLASSQAVSS